MGGACAADGPIGAGEGGVPADAPLQAELALLSWKKVEDLSGDGGVVKKTLHAPEGWQAGALLAAC